MTSPQTTFTQASGSIHDSRKRWMGYALTLSVALHMGAALVFIIASGLGSNRNNSPSFIFQDVDLSPSITAPAKTSAVPPAQPPAMTPTAPAEELPVEQAAPVPAHVPAAESTVSPEAKSGIMSTPLGLGMTHGYFSGLADGRTLRDEIRSYYFEMVEKINQQWWEKAGLLKEPLRQDGIFDVLVQRDGTIVSIRILQGSGSSEADRLLMEIIKNASPLPPLPSTYVLDMFQAPLRIKAPSFLFRLAN